jgi:hypothetical protein
MKSGPCFRAAGSFGFAQTRNRLLRTQGPSTAQTTGVAVISSGRDDRVMRRIWVVSQFGFPLHIQSGADASAQFVGRVARLSRNVRQPNQVLGD